MSTNYENYKDGIDNWADMWEKAQKKGIFDDAPKPPITSPQTAIDSFFGPVDTKPSERLDEVDAKYWKAISKLADSHSFKPELVNEVLKESEANAELEQLKKGKIFISNDRAMRMIAPDMVSKVQAGALVECEIKGQKVNIGYATGKESKFYIEAFVSKEKLGDMADTIANTANPIRHNTTGPDQELNDKSLGTTFTPEDLEALGELKLKLHDLEAKLSSFEGRGENGKKFESQIIAVKKKIEELSDALNKGWSISQQGD